MNIQKFKLKKVRINKKSKPFIIDNQQWEYIKKIDSYLLYINNKENEWSYLLLNIGSVVNKKSGLSSREEAIKNGEENIKIAQEEINEHVKELKIFFKNLKEKKV